MEYKDLTFEEFEKAFKSVKHKKAAWHDDIDRNVIIKVYDKISDPLFMIFHSLFNVYLIFKVGNIEEIGNYRPVSVLPIFSKVLEGIIY